MFVLFFMFLIFIRDIFDKPLTKAALESWWKRAPKVDPFKQDTYNIPEFRLLTDHGSCWVIEVSSYTTRKLKYVFVFIFSYLLVKTLSNP